MPSDRHHVAAGAVTYRASDHYLGLFAYHAAKVTRTYFLDRGTHEKKPGSQVLAERVNLSHDTVNNHALAFQLLTELFRRGASKRAKFLWRTLYKAHWIAAAKDWRKHQDFEIALNDLETFYAHAMNPDEAAQSKEREQSLAERLHVFVSRADRELERLQSLADRDRRLLPHVRKLRKAYADHMLPAIQELRDEIDKAQEKSQRAEKALAELGFGPRWEKQ